MNLRQTLNPGRSVFLLCLAIFLVGCESQPPGDAGDKPRTKIVLQTFPSPEEAAFWAFLQPPENWEGKKPWKPHMVGVNKTATLALYRKHAVRCDLNGDGKEEWLFNLNFYVDVCSKDGGSFGLEGTSGMRKWALVQQIDSGYVVRHIEHLLSLPHVFTSTTNGWNDLVVVARGVRDERGIRRGSATKLIWKADGSGYEHALTMPIRTQDGLSDEAWAAFLKKAELGDELPYLWR